MELQLSCLWNSRDVWEKKSTMGTEHDIFEKKEGNILFAY